MDRTHVSLSSCWWSLRNWSIAAPCVKITIASTSSASASRINRYDESARQVEQLRFDAPHQLMSAVSTNRLPTARIGATHSTIRA